MLNLQSFACWASRGRHFIETAAAQRMHLKALYLTGYVQGKGETLDLPLYARTDYDMTKPRPCNSSQPVPYCVKYCLATVSLLAPSCVSLDDSAT